MELPVYCVNHQPLVAKIGVWLFSYFFLLVSFWRKIIFFPLPFLYLFLFFFFSPCCYLKHVIRKRFARSGQKPIGHSRWSSSDTVLPFCLWKWMNELLYVLFFQISRFNCLSLEKDSESLIKVYNFYF